MHACRLTSCSHSKGTRFLAKDVDCIQCNREPRTNHLGASSVFEVTTNTTISIAATQQTLSCFCQHCITGLNKNIMSFNIVYLDRNKIVIGEASTDNMQQWPLHKAILVLASSQ